MNRIEGMQAQRQDFENYLRLWSLAPDGDVIVTHTSRLLPVRRGGVPLMLKLSHTSEERYGGQLMLWWDGEGAVRILEHDDDALLMERATGPRSVSDMARSGEDDAASLIICEVARRLHAPRSGSAPAAISLDLWFRDLFPAADRHGGILVAAAETARALLGEPRDIRVLHGDLHHGNVLDGGARGFLAIDPKRLLGERSFDFANIFCNPDAAVATRPGRLTRQAGIVAEAAGLDRERLMRWILAYAGLSAAWHLDDGTDPALALAVAEIAKWEIEGG
jgi:streptomycin 6-kinase